jgi:hypothetical protein
MIPRSAYPAGSSDAAADHVDSFTAETKPD